MCRRTYFQRGSQENQAGTWLRGGSPRKSVQSRSLTSLTGEVSRLDWRAPGQSGNRQGEFSDLSCRASDTNNLQSTLLLGRSQTPRNVNFEIICVLSRRTYGHGDEEEPARH
jgi:hypothetical protein